MTHNSTHPDRRISLEAQQAKRERDQAIVERQMLEVGRDFWKGRFERLQDEHSEALDEVERLRQKLEEK